MAESPWGRKPTGGSTNGASGGGGNRGGNNNGGGRKPENNPLEKLVRDAHERMRGGMNNFGGGNANGGFSNSQLISMFACFIFVVWLATGIYRVNSDELGVVTRFGAYDRTSTPGLNYHLPFPIEQVFIPSVTSVNRMEIGVRSGSDNPNVRVAKLKSSSVDSESAQAREGLMLTGDRNIVDIDFEVQWKIDAAHPEKFLFNMRDAAANVKPVAESAMREVIARNNLDDVLTSAQSQIAEDTKQLMQQMFDEYDAGVEIIAVNLSRPDVPSQVIDEFQDVKRAEQDKQTAESVAEGYRNEIIPRAKGDGAKMIEDAEAYKSKVIADAVGDASRFKQIYAEYAQAKDVTKRRMYLETMEAVLKNMPKTIVDSAAKSVVPVLPLGIQAPQNIAPAAGAAAPAASTPTATTR